MLKEAAALGDVPVIIAGDFNMDTLESPGIQSAISQGQWIDAAVAMGNTSPTSDAGKATRRIDAILMNRIAATAITSKTEVVVENSDLIPTHSPVIIKNTNMGRYWEKTLKMILPKQFEETSKIPKGTNDNPLDITKRAQAWDKARKTGQTDTMLEVFGELLEEYLTSALDIRDDQRNKYVGRGKITKPVIKINSARQKRKGAISKEDINRLKTMRTLEQLIRIAKKQNGPSTPSHETMKLWRKVKKLDPSIQGDMPYEDHRLRKHLQKTKLDYSKSFTPRFQRECTRPQKKGGGA
eukprot:TRINITY_DN5422_c0_g1_i1.p1 TRINITY_DN5422_c0_g1~~TRINITY_DN5422_c0_g1_i1.p1  ORF type:complete len:296 (+),score=66.09 TRINITY_DN5422_c0_g1_i1:58-945(+)